MLLMNWLWRILGYRRHWVIRNTRSPEAHPLYLESDHGIAITWTATVRWRKKFYEYKEAEIAWLGLPWFAKIEEVNP